MTEKKGNRKRVLMLGIVILLFIAFAEDREYFGAEPAFGCPSSARAAVSSRSGASPSLRTSARRCRSRRSEPATPPSCRCGRPRSTPPGGSPGRVARWSPGSP